MPTEVYSAIEDFLKKNPDVLKHYVKKNKEKLRPITNSESSNTPYYREKFAKELLPVLDAVLVDNKARIFRYSNYPSMQPSTLRARIEQAWYYVMDYLDPEGRYRVLRKNANLVRSQNGLILMMIDDNKTEPMIADIISEFEMSPRSWKLAFEDFIENGKEGEKKVFGNLNLVEEDMTYINNSLFGIENIVHSYSEKQLTVLKLSSEDAKRMKL